MNSTKLLTTTILALLLLAACGNGGGKKVKNLFAKAAAEETTANTDENIGENIGENGVKTYTGTYTGYYNERYGYGIDYPDILIPQGESDSGDGQTFISEDGRSKMSVYYDFRMMSGELDPIEKAFEDDVKLLNPTHKELSETHYELRGTTDKGRLFSRKTIRGEHAYYTVAMEYDKADAALFADIRRHVYERFYLMGVSDSFVELLFNFTNECFWEKNFNRLLRDNDKRLAKYIDPKMDIRRYYNPGAIAYLYDRKQNFGFDDYTDFDTEPMDGGETSLKKLPKDAPPCELDFNHGKGFPELYYGELSRLPHEVVNPETLETRAVKLPYPDAKIMVLYLPSYYNENVNPSGFYFIETPDGWKLAFVDDSLCSG